MALRRPSSAALPALARVLVVGAYSPLRLGVRALLEQEGFEVCAEAPDAAGAVESALREQPDICVVDLDVPGGGIWAIGEIADALPDTAVVALGGSEDESEVLAALRSGAAAYLLKGAGGDSLPLALRAVLEGESALPRHLLAGLVARIDEQERRQEALSRLGVRLTSREAQIAGLLAEGLGTHEIAARLFVSPETVRTHVSSVVRKLGAVDRAAAIELLSGRVPAGR